ncbi:hypothetical protein [Bacillus pseudomycoides]|uniref:hypothetical protein n=1 Tax=Bacillus pseudomycoides TaxID=64104 RepID=UPI000BEB6D0D|nr:hypothetical protein [Bacillus pseudomycoides]PED05061.1 hypothetical protein COO19_28705 [Bacillus pseudomycoides]PEI92807.1 hypothetical protein CN686_19850 [Bacillus pseudomycoides]PEK06668.1 hypothetical protein CN693_29255 [Bacillus pseudomycoides]PEM73755.1 hypothetical protein CN619_13625 [Bacillus pseudomycoides]PEO06539.1 hypothetical protein CN542_27425 [Bacillus pseudomycoides]
MLKKIMVSSALLTGVLGVSIIAPSESKAETSNAIETNSSANQQYISEGTEFPNGINSPFAPNSFEQNNLMQENLAAAFKWRYNANYKFSTSIQVKKTVPASNNGYIGVAFQNNKPFKFNVIVKNLSSGKTITHTVQGKPTSGNQHVTNFFGPMKAGNYVVTLVNTDKSWHQGNVWLGW